MARTIKLTDIEIISLNYTTVDGRMAVSYAVNDEDGVQREWNYIIIWKNGFPGPEEYPEYPNYPDNWFEYSKTEKANKDKFVSEVLKTIKKLEKLD